MGRLFDLPGCKMEYLYVLWGACECGSPDERMYRPVDRGDLALRRFEPLCKKCALLWEKTKGLHGEEARSEAEAFLTRERRRI